MPSFRQQLTRVSHFLKQQNLAEQTIKYKGDTALLVIDVQKQFCDPNGLRGNKKTDTVSKRIQSIVPEFRDAGIPVYVIYYSKKKKEPSKIDFYKFKPMPNDVLIAKNNNSAFKGSNIKKVLKKDRRKSLLICGFNLNACVKKTVIDARKKGFDVCVLEDLTGNAKINKNIGAVPDN